MIQDKSRSFWFGASDTSFVIGNYDTKTFKKWWLEKLGLRENTLSNKAMKTGTHYEHKILDTIPGIRKDHQIIIEDLRLRVNLDGDKEDCIYEVKTYRHDKGFKLPKKYKEQVQVQMFAKECRNAYIVAYGLEEGDYLNYFNAIDASRITYHKIEYDEKFIEDYLIRLKYLVKCLNEGILPKGSDLD